MVDAQKLQKQHSVKRVDFGGIPADLKVPEDLDIPKDPKCRESTIKIKYSPSLN
jgi:hypothetical protein